MERTDTIAQVFSVKGLQGLRVTSLNPPTLQNPIKSNNHYRNEWTSLQLILQWKGLKSIIRLNINNVIYSLNWHTRNWLIQRGVPSYYTSTRWKGLLIRIPTMTRNLRLVVVSFVRSYNTIFSPILIWYQCGIPHTSSRT